jgi:CheY-like chemotaxis protein
VRLERDLDPRVPAFPVDVNRWQQVFVNLAGNAHQALVAARTKDRLIRFQTRLKGTDVVVRVSDSGPGIPEHLRTRVFEPFFTTKENGTGLGLGICFGIVRDHGGTIELESGHERGAHFRVTIPLTEGIEAPAPTPPVEALPEAGRGRRVLVVDDDPYVCDVVVKTLQFHRYDVEVARDGAHALELAGKDAFDVILTDVRMPGEVDGIELHEALKRDHPNAAERVVFMTGNLLDERTMRWLERQGARCIEKPFDIRHLASVVDEVAQARGSPATPAAPTAPRTAPQV